MAGEIAGGVAVTIFTEGYANPRCFVKTVRDAPPQPPGQGCHFTLVILRNTLQRFAPPSDIKSLTSNFYGLTPCSRGDQHFDCGPVARVAPLPSLFDSRLPRKVVNLVAEVIARFPRNYSQADFHYIAVSRVIEIFQGEGTRLRAKGGRFSCRMSLTKASCSLF